MNKEDLIEVNLDGDIKEFFVNQRKVLMGYVLGKTLAKADIPNTPNTRGYMGKKNSNVLSMEKTIKNSPDLFMYKNNGIFVIAQDYKRNDDGTITVYLGPEDGIINGIHTKTTLAKKGNDITMTSISIYFDLPQEHLVDIIVAKNSSTPTKLISIADKLGAFDCVKKDLQDSNIMYNESAIGDTEIRTILKIAAIFYVEEMSGDFIYKDNKRFARLLRMSDQLVVDQMSGKNYLQKTKYILNDMVGYYEQISTDIEFFALLRKNLKGAWIRNNRINGMLAYNIINAINFAFYVPPNTFHPYYRKGYDIQRILNITTMSFYEIIKVLKRYEDEGLKASDICRGRNLHQEIQNILLKTDLLMKQI